MVVSIINTKMDNISKIDLSQIKYQLCPYEILKHCPTLDFAPLYKTVFDYVLCILCFKMKWHCFMLMLEVLLNVLEYHVILC